MVGGASRTLLRLAQRLVTDAGIGIGDDEKRRSCDACRCLRRVGVHHSAPLAREVDQVTAQNGADALVTLVLKVIALCVDVRDLTLDAHNIAVLLHAEMSGESIEAAVTVALQNLVEEGRIEFANNRLSAPVVGRQDVD